MSVTGRVGAAWQRFWFTPQPTSTLAVFRITFGLLVFAWTLAFVPDVNAFFGAHGVEARPPLNLSNGWWGVLNISDAHGLVVGLYAMLLVASLALAVGYRTRLASVLVFVGVMSIERRAPAVLNGGDDLLRILSFFFMFAPAGAALSVDRWRKHRDSFWEFPARAPWALRLIQVQVSVMYLASVWEKLQGAPWRNGTAVSLSLGLQDLQRFPAPGFITHSLVISSVMSYSTLAIELMVGVLVWNRAARPLVLALGASLHLGIDIFLRVTFFSETVLTSYIAFLSPAAAIAVVLFLRDRLLRSADRARQISSSTASGGSEPVLRWRA